MSLACRCHSDLFPCEAHHPLPPSLTLPDAITKLSPHLWIRAGTRCCSHRHSPSLTVTHCHSPLLTVTHHYCRWILRFPASGEANLRLEATAHQSPPRASSLIGLNTVEHARHLQRATQCDLMVDSLLCNAHTSGTDALWAGTPVITLPADNQAARVGLSLLRSVGQPQLVVRSMRAYEDVSVELASAGSHAGSWDAW